MDNNLYLYKNDFRDLEVDGEFFPVREWEIRSLLTKDEILAIFIIPGTSEGGRPDRRVQCPLFEYDKKTDSIVGESEKMSLDDRMRAVIRSARVTTPELYGPDFKGQCIHVHFFLAGYEGHLMACIPGWDDMPFHFYVRPNLVNMSWVAPVPRGSK